MKAQDILNSYIEKHWKEWLQFSTRLTNDSVRGSDLLAETLLKVLENQRSKAEELAVEDKLHQYVLRSIYYMAIDKSSRYHTKYTKYSLHWSPETKIETQAEDKTWLGSRIDNEYLDAYISMMPVLDATIIRIYMMQDFSYQDLSEKTGIPVKTLYKLVENALNKIKRNAQSRSSSKDS